MKDVCGFGHVVVAIVVVVVVVVVGGGGSSSSSSHLPQNQIGQLLVTGTQ